MPQGVRSDGRRAEGQSSRADYLVEGEETWQPDTRRNVPSVVDEAPPKNNER